MFSFLAAVRHLGGPVRKQSIRTTPPLRSLRQNHCGSQVTSSKQGSFYVRYTAINKSFIKSKTSSIKKIVRYTEDFVIYRFVMSRFLCLYIPNSQLPLLDLLIKDFLSTRLIAKNALVSSFNSPCCELTVHEQTTLLKQGLQNIKSQP